MKFNSLIPELAVFDLARTKLFYLDTLGFQLEYERDLDKFMFLSFEGSQFMFEELHEDGWNTGVLEYPLGRGINFSIQCKEFEEVYKRVKWKCVPLYREMMTSYYQADGKVIEQKEFLLQDPDGYLLRFTN